MDTLETLSVPPGLGCSEWPAFDFRDEQHDQVIEFSMEQFYSVRPVTSEVDGCLSLGAQSDKCRRLLPKRLNRSMG
jgi:hypothetical protein